VLSAKPQAKNQHRLKNFKEYYENEVDQRDLRRACLCLRLTKVANDICAKKATDINGLAPTVVRLGKQEVQIKMTEELCEVWRYVHHNAMLSITGKQFRRCLLQCFMLSFVLQNMIRCLSGFGTCAVNIIQTGTL
jgi:hypothetical protein